MSLVLVAAATIALAACTPTRPAPTSGPPSSAGDSITGVGPSAPSVTSPPPATSARPTSSTEPGGPFASAGSIVLVGNDGSLSLVDATGRMSVLASADEGLLGFPAWSPDASHIAAISYDGTDDTILVFDAPGAAAGQPLEPVAIFRSPVIGPFYLSWTPDGRAVSFLANEAGDLSLRIAPADGSAPLDGSGPGATIRSGSPFYYDWLGRDRLLAHVGSGPDALLGEIDLHGVATAPALDSPGDFRSAVVSHDRAYISYVRLAAGGSAEVVVAARDGSGEHAIPVFGTAAVAFDPVGHTIASIGPSEPAQPSFGFPVGALRLIDAETGQARTLLGGSVVSFWWSPDGATIAALRVQAVADSTASLGSTSAAQATQVRLLFVDLASGEVEAQAVVQPGQRFLDQLLPYFDQYALSHQLWAPDSSSFLLPVVAQGGATRVAVMFRNGDPTAFLEGVIGFWSP